MRIDVITIFPRMVEALLPFGIVHRAQEAGVLEVRVHDLRLWGIGPHRQVDDAPFGGGGGMVLMPSPLFAAVEAIEAADDTARGRRILLSPRGRRCDQAYLCALARQPRLLLVCGRYEGVDERVREHLVDEELSLGDYVLSGGEVPALAVIEGVARLLPGALGHPAAVEQDSFAAGGLDWPSWTRPATFRGLPVPEVLLSGHHERIAKWRRNKSLELTSQRRPDLLQKSGNRLESAGNGIKLTQGRIRE
ncbi:MAG: tRNA (guanosine(37)-N1)-methyltransferase TrmD [Acidobacteriota bacterium]